MHWRWLLAALIVGCDAAPERQCDAGPCGPSPALEDGQACDDEARCKGKACLDLGRGRVCATPCETNASCGTDRCLPRPTSAPSALRLLCERGGRAGDRFLGEPCAADADCQSGLCDKGRCTELCTSCTSPARCETSTLTRQSLSAELKTCVLPLPGSIIELGALSPTTAGAEVGFDVGAEHGSFLLFAQSQSTARVGLRKLVAPDGSVLVDLDQPQSSLMRASVEIGLATALVPSSDDPKAQLKVGRYRATFSTYDPAQDKPVAIAGKIDRVAVVLRPRLLDGGVIDLTLHFAPGTGLTQGSAASSAEVTSMLSRFDALYQQLAGVRLGQVRYADLTAAENEVSTGDQARAICRKYSQAGPRGASINLYLVSKLSFAGGFAGSIPGAPVYGGPNSGIVIQRQASAQGTGTLMAHEVAHFLGLWHTTEQGGDADTISDTPRCPGGTAVKDCPDYRNLMFPFFPTSDPLSLSPGQVNVLRKSPWLVQPFFLGACGATPVLDASTGLGTSTLEGTSALQGSCGGERGAERVHLYRLDQPASALAISARGVGFAPLVHVRHARCEDAKTEVGCKAGSPTAPATLTLAAPKPGAYFVIVDSADGGMGRYELSITRKP